MATLALGAVNTVVATIAIHPWVLVQITDIEVAVLDGLFRGESYGELAEHLHYSPYYIKDVADRLRYRFHAKSNTNLVYLVMYPYRIDALDWQQACQKLEAELEERRQQYQSDLEILKSLAPEERVAIANTESRFLWPYMPGWPRTPPRELVPGVPEASDAA